MRNIRQLLVAFLMSAVVACGGGGTLGESGTPTTPSYSIALALTDASGAVSKDLSKANPLKLKATVTATNGSAANKLVTFTINDPELASFNNGAGTAQTLSNGTAEIGLLVGTKSGAGEVTASVEGGTPVKIAFTSSGDIGAGGAFKISLETFTVDGSVATEVAKESPLTIKATLVSSTGVVQSGKLIQFSIDNSSLASFNNDAGTAVTNASGIATIGLVAGTKSGAGVITAVMAEDDEFRVTKAFSSKGDGGVVDSTPVGSILLYADKLQLGAGSADRVELSALVRDRNNILMKNVKVQFSADNDSELEVVSEMTGTDGVAKANLSSKTNFNLRTIKVTATAGSENKTSDVDIKVIGTNINVVGPNAVVLGGTVEFSISLLDSTGKGIQNSVVQLSSSLKNTFNNVSPITDPSTGRAVVTYTAANGGSDVITATALGVSTTFVVLVDPDSFAFEPATTSSVQEIPLNTAAPVAVKWLRNNSPLVSNDVLFTTTRGVIAPTADSLSNKVVATQTTNNSGIAEVFVRSDFAGVTNIGASSTANGAKISANKLVEYIATTPSVTKGIEVQVFPAQLGSGEKATVQAVLRDEKDNPIKNQVVAFSLSNSAGGQLSPSTGVTNSQGVATTEFTADVNSGGSGSPNSPQGLRINAVLANNSDVKGDTGVVVGRRTLFFRFGSGDVLESVEPNLYSVPYAIIVTDAAGNPVPNQQLNVSVTPNAFKKGVFLKRPLIGTFVNWESVPTITCASEDVDRDGVLDTGEDINGDMQITPGNVATVSRTVVADADGIAQVNIIYPREYATWVDVNLSVSSTAAGTENVSSRNLTLPILGAHTTTESDPPSDSPFGRGRQPDVDRLLYEEGLPLCSDTN
ncbi:MAG: Ig-like domain-containing protein [Gammaproteobacteria bacterium]|nr:Ig-like domain-containing protein [Gammaproteobacteria bacterium]